MTPKRYLLGFFLLLACLLCLSVAINRVVDPFQYYRDITIKGFNEIKPEFGPRERQVKPVIVRSEQPATLIFGSSYAEIGFNPSHPALRAAGKSYNFALAGATWQMVFCHVQYAIKYDTGLRQIVLGIHPEAMPAYSCEKDFDKMLHPEELAFLISLDALQASIKTVFANRKATHTVDGMFFYKRGKQGTLRRFQRDFSKLPPCKTVRSSLSDQEQRVADARSIDLQGLQQIVRMSIRRGIVLKLVVYPLHALQIEQQYQCGARRTKWSVLKQILAMTERENSSLVELWDFEGYHAIGTEPISDAPGVYWQDPGHFNYEFGNIMLDEMFSVEPINLGIRLNTRNLEDRATSESSARKYYIDGHQEFLKKLNELLSSPVT